MSLTRRRLLSALAATLLLAAGAGCGRPAPPRLMVLALDGMDPGTVDLLMAEGRLPNFARLRQEGAYGRLLAREPLLSPVLWTTVATGRPPEEHGIGHFTAVDASGETLPATSSMRRVKAIWNVLSEHDRRVAVVGWWASWPAEAVNGAVVSDHTCYHFLFPEADGKAGAGDRLTYPPALVERIAPWIRRPGDVGGRELRPFLDVDPAELERPFDFEDDVSHFRWALATAETYRRIGLELWQLERPDLLMTYIEAPDSVSHLFGHLFRASGLAGELAGQQRRFGRAVEETYVYADRLLGEYMLAADETTTLVVLSDHGFDLGAPLDDPSKSRDLRRVSEQFHTRQGILYLYGNRVRRHARLDRPKLLDVAPTLLALAGLPPAADMPGRVLHEGIDIEEPVARVASYEGGASAGTVVRDPEADPRILERLESLGYVGGPDPAPRSPQGQRNIAALHFEAGRFAEAARLYAELVEESPDDASLRTSLAGALGAQGLYDAALEQLDAATGLAPLNAEAYHNRAVILERRGEEAAAVEQYRTAVRYRPDYEPSRRALQRLTGTAEVYLPRTPGERRARDLTATAEAAARRGDYAAAMAQLDEAERLAPDYVPVHHYRSNVAYLMGDVTAAIGALEKALALEPDNELFKTNLERLKRQRR